ncbi:MAG: PEGA domain-containing protein [Planctomycetes bacterium]|nr:PEGA domain-containing protein [Planctomycetota bacterium]
MIVACGEVPITGASDGTARRRISKRSELGSNEGEQSMLRSVQGVVAITALLAVSSCASIVTGSEDRVKINSVPMGAHYETNTGHKGTTPAEIVVADKTTLQIRCTMEGYQDASASLPPRMSGWFLGNILLGGIVGIVIDLVSGNYQTHDDEVVITLMKIVPVAAPTSAPAQP